MATCTGHTYTVCAQMELPPAHMTAGDDKYSRGIKNNFRFSGQNRHEKWCEITNRGGWSHTVVLGSWLKSACWFTFVAAGEQSSTFSLLWDTYLYMSLHVQKHSSCKTYRIRTVVLFADLTMDCVLPGKAAFFFFWNSVFKLKNSYGLVATACAVVKERGVSLSSSDLGLQAKCLRRVHSVKAASVSWQYKM